MSMADHTQLGFQTNRSQILIDLAITFIVVTTFAVSLRGVARKLQAGPWIWADFVIILAWMFNMALYGVIITEATLGDGQHSSTLSIQNQYKIAELGFYVESILYAIGVNLPKLAILDIYRRVFIDKVSHWFIYGAQFLIVVLIIISAPIVVTLCHPLSFFWDKSTPGGWCKDYIPIFTASSAYNLATDFIVLVLPIPMIFKLQASRRDKIELMLIFACSSLGLITAVIRVIAFQRASLDPDIIYVGFPEETWTMVEMGVYLICACTITYSPLIHWIRLGCPLAALSRGLVHYLDSIEASQGSGPAAVQPDSESERYRQRLDRQSKALNLTSTCETLVHSDSVPTSEALEKNESRQGLHAIYVRHGFETASLREENVV